MQYSFTDLLTNSTVNDMRTVCRLHTVLPSHFTVLFKFLFHLSHPHHLGTFSSSSYLTNKLLNKMIFR